MPSAAQAGDQPNCEGRRCTRRGSGATERQRRGGRGGGRGGGRRGGGETAEDQTKFFFENGKNSTRHSWQKEDRPIRGCARPRSRRRAHLLRRDPENS